MEVAVNGENTEVCNQHVKYLDDDNEIIEQYIENTSNLNLISYTIEDAKLINYTEIIPVLIGSIQELTKKIEVLEAKVSNKKEK